jgi:hypothetical protein
MNNPYEVQPASFQPILEGFGMYQQATQEREAEQAAQARQQQIMEEGAGLLQGNDTQALAEWALRNPDQRNNFIEAIELQDAMTSRPRVSTAKDALSGQFTAVEAYTKRLEEIKRKGGTAPQLEKAIAEGEDVVRELALKDLAMFSPDAHKVYMESQPKPKDKGFTLSEGQARFDDQNNMVAYNPKTVSTLDSELKAGKDKFDRAAKLRGEVEKVSKVYRDVEDAYGRIVAASEDSSGAADMALIFNYMKMLDPGSTVREGEFATAAQTGGLPAYIQNIYNKTKNGQFVSDTQRADFLRQARKQFEKSSKKQDRRLSDYEKLGKRYGLERGDIIVSEVESAPNSVVISAHPQYGDITEGDIQQTMSDSGMTRDEVMSRLQGG